MTDTIKQKMKQISEDLGELNRQGKVKRFGGEKGYAKVYQIIPGCSIFVHHSSDDSLVIDLQITVEATNKFYREGLDREAKLIQEFENFFNNEVSRETFHHPLDGLRAVRYCKNISDESLNSILKTIQELKQNFSNSR